MLFILEIRIGKIESFKRGKNWFNVNHSYPTSNFEPDKTCQFLDAHPGTDIMYKFCIIKWRLWARGTKSLHEARLPCIQF